MLARKLMKVGGVVVPTGPIPFFAFEMNETSGLTLYDTGSNANGRTATIDGTNQMLADLGSGRRGVDFVVGGATVSGTDVLAKSTGNYAIELHFYKDPYIGSQYQGLLQLRGSGSEPLILMCANGTGGYTTFGVTSVDTNVIARCRFASALANNGANEWHHIVVNIIDKVVGDFYLNNVTQVKVAASLWPSTPNVTRLGGTYDNSTTYTLDGKMNFVRLYDRTLTAAEVAALYAAR